MKKVVLVCMLVLLTLSTVYAADPIAEWKLDEGTGTVAADSVGSHDGTLQGNVTWVADAPAVTGSSYSVQFGGGANDYIAIAGDLAPESITVAFWAKATGLHGIQTIIGKYSAWPGSYEIGFDSNANFAFRVWDNASAWEKWVGGSATDPFTTTEFYNGKWHHFASTLDKATGAASVYVDGVIVETLYHTPDSGVRTTGQVLNFGRRPYIGAESSYNGLLGKVSVYDVALSAAEIALLCPPIVVPPVTDNPIAEWKLDEGTGTVAADSVGTHDGNLLGNVTWVADAPAATGSSYSVLFGGTANDYIAISGDIAPESTTVAFWAKATGEYKNQTIIGKYGEWPGSYELVIDGAGLFNWRVWDNASAWEKWVGGTAVDPFTFTEFYDTKWHHFAGTLDKVTGEVSLYVDGLLVETLYHTPNSGLRVTGQALTFGRRAHPAAPNSYNGLLGKVSIYEKALSAAQIAALVNPVVVTNSLSGTVVLSDFGGDKTTIPVTVDLGEGIVIPLNLDADGKFTIQDVPIGTYDVKIKASHWLAKMTPGVAVVSGANIMDSITLINGDVVDNNEVDFSDINAARAAYGSFPGDETWNDNADVDGSGEVDFTDINIVRSKYGEIGD